MLQKYGFGALPLCLILFLSPQFYYIPSAHSERVGPAGGDGLAHEVFFIS